MTVFGFHWRIGQCWLTRTIMDLTTDTSLVVSLFGMTLSGLFRWVRTVSYSLQHGLVIGLSMFGSKFYVPKCDPAH